MSQAIVVPSSFSGPVAAVFQGQQAGDDLSGGITGGYGLLKYRGKVWSILHSGNTMVLMRDDASDPGPRGNVDLVIIKANPQLSKTWYESGWDENNNAAPDCASANGIVPDSGVPKKQSNACATCPRNAWGSAPNGGKGKACGDHRRLAVVPLADLRNEHFGGPLLLRCPAASLQDMAAFDSRYKGMGYPYFTMGVKIGFDPQESYPKFTFAAIRPLSEDEGKIVMEMRNSPETARVISEGSAPAVAQVTAPAQGAFLEAAPATQMAATTQVAPQPAAAPAVAPVAQPTPAAAPAPAVAQPAPVVAQPEHVAPAVDGAGVAGGTPATTSAGGFGPVAVEAPAANPATVGAAAGNGNVGAAPAAATAPAQRPAAVMTGFGAAAPETTQAAQPPAAAAPVAASPVEAPAAAPPAAATPANAPGTVSAFEGSIDDRLNALLG